MLRIFNLTSADEKCEDCDAEVEAEACPESCPDLLTMDKVIQNIELSEVYSWKCLDKHITNGKCCKNYIQKQYPRWEHNYFAFISVLGVSENSIVSAKEWKFKFELVFEFRSKYYAFPFRTSYDALKNLEKLIDAEVLIRSFVHCVIIFFYTKKKHKESKQKLFPCKSYPEPYNKKCIDSSLYEEMKEDVKVLCRRSLPGFLELKALRAGAKQVDIIRKFCPKKKYIQHLFSSPSLLLKNWFFCNLVESDMTFYAPLEKLLRSRAEAQLSKWKKFATRNHMKLENLCKQKMTEKQAFHTVYAIRRLLEGSRMFYHWALAFEGPNHLLRIEFFDTSEIEWLLVCAC
ncbi:hypothetical protein RFI_04604 [Reticulomyxa filosa]|uniref:Uncharacterized protein n=1 Tax=Reticulomyxa filosa TaxID=46433 RepID=X6P4I9_RETFI|nr:hypothetical protein RFI_04604 [Reticulomyxa filosa]|eukprot:ETO32512.1 hypothetical protein RFI_04604 [Reticulomyxa filosa]